MPLSEGEINCKENKITSKKDSLLFNNIKIKDQFG
jgi:hypothetical protein